MPRTPPTPPTVLVLALFSATACKTVLPPAPTAPGATLPTVSTLPALVPLSQALPPESSPGGALLPAGLCSFPGYLHNDLACENVPPLTHVVLLANLTDRTTAETLVAEHTGKLPPGYPMVLTRHELPLDGDPGPPLATVDGAVGPLLADVATPPRKQPLAAALRVVAGLFPDAPSAHLFRKDILGGLGSVHSVAGLPLQESGELDHLAFERSQSVAVAIVHPAPAYADADIQRLSNSDGALNANDEEKRWTLALSRLRPACTVRAGQVFESDRAALYETSRRFAPIVCENGARATPGRGPQVHSRAWVAWEATRLESVVKVEPDGVFIYQITHVQCAMATIEKLPFVWGAPAPVAKRSDGGCGRGPS